MIEFNANIGSIGQQGNSSLSGSSKLSNAGGSDSGFSNTIKAAGDYITKVDDLQQSSNVSIMEMLSGKNEDLNTVVANVAKADMSFKLLVGVRNKLIEAYKQTMNMPI
jgi:flagellar hook-basal body complex protein FliE